MPSEVAPLVDAVNHHIARYRRVLDEQSQFLADASHQLRTPLAIMLTQAQYALRERDPARAQEGLRAIVGQLGRTRRLTEQLLSLAHANQAESLPRQLLDMNDVSREVVLKYLPLAHEKQQDLGWSCAEAEDGVDTSLPVSGSEAELHEALSNLVHNAIHYAPAGARITVSVGRADGRVEVAVSDNGPGLDPELRARAFARFERVGTDRPEAASSGSGLAWRSRGPMRAATTATSSCAMESPMARRRRPGIGAVAAAGADGVAVPPHRRDRTQGRSVVSSCFFLQLSMGWLPCSGITPGFRGATAQGKRIRSLLA